MTARRTPSRALRRLPVLAAGLVLALSGCGSEEAGGGAEAGSSGSSASTSESAASTTAALTVDAAAATAGKCMVPTAEALSTEATAFEGTVTALEDGMATLEVDHWYAGEEAEEVTVDAPDEDLQALILAVDFEVGKTYLVSATDGQVSLCGFTAEKTPELEALYAEAFGA